jgi:hypothetical protein
MGADFEAEIPGIFLHQLLDHVRRERPVELAGAVVADRAEQRAIVVRAVPGGLDVIVNELVACQMELHIAHLVALSRTNETSGFDT